MARSDLALYDSVLSSNLPREDKSALRRWYESAVTLPESLRPSKDQMHGGLSAFRQGSESLLTGAVLGILNVESPGGLEPLGIPLDGLAGLMFLGGGALAGKSDVAPTAKNIGAVASAVFAKRMVEKFCIERRLAKGKALPAHLQTGSTVSGDVPARRDVTSDPIVQAAADL